jgi:hypothetical protein
MTFALPSQLRSRLAGITADALRRDEDVAAEE